MSQPKITLEQWATFKAVVDEGSFTKAGSATQAIAKKYSS